MTKDLEKYTGRSQTLAANGDRVGALVLAAANEYEMANRAEKVSLSDMARIKAESEKYLRYCAEHGVLPDIRGIASRLGCSRQALYDRASRHPGGEFDAWLQDFSDLCGQITAAAALEGAVQPVVAIFTMKSRYGWREGVVQIELQSNNAIGPTLSEEELAERIAADVVIDDSALEG